MANPERAQRILTQATVKELIKRLETYLALDGAAKRDEAMILASRTITVTSCRDFADFLSGEIVMITMADAEDAIRREEEVPRLQEEIERLRGLIPKKKLKAYDKKMDEPQKA